MLRATIEQARDRDELATDARDSLRRYCTATAPAGLWTGKERAKMHAAGYGDDELAAMEKAMVFDRNESWIPMLEAMFAEGDAFVAVGAGHLRGKRGLVERLRERGWSVTNVRE